MREVSQTRFGTILMFVFALLAACSFMVVIQPARVDAERATEYYCDRYVRYVGEVTDGAGNRYVSMEYGLLGNDSARSQFGEAGGTIEGPSAANCSLIANTNDVNDTRWCSSDWAQFWDCEGNIVYKNDAYKFILGGTPTKVYLGTPLKTPNDQEKYGNNINLLVGDLFDPTRVSNGVSAVADYPFAGINDAGQASVNGAAIVCHGLGGMPEHVGCNKDVYTAGVNGRPASWAGYLNGGSPAVAIDAVNGFIRGTVFRSSATPIAALSDFPFFNQGGSDRFNLILKGVNTQDPWFTCNPAWNNGPAPNSPAGCNTNFKNTKMSLFMTYFIPANSTVTNPACGTLSTEPSAPEAGVPFSLTARVTTPSGIVGTGGAVRLYTPTGGAITGGINTTNNSVVYTNSSVTIDGVVIPAPGEGYQVRWSYSYNWAGGSNTINCEAGLGLPDSGVDVGLKPYLQVYGGDVSTGAAINTFNQGTPNFYGSGSQLATFANGSIAEFASSLLGAATRPKGLTFANSTGVYGGGFGIFANTPITNYTNAQAIADCNAVGNNVANARRCLYVDGDYTVTPANVVNFGNGPWSIGTIPSFYLIATGNIYIEPGVTSMSGVYIAGGSAPGGGSIYTCRPASYTPLVISQQCGNQLTINGAFLARKIHFTRTANTLRQSNGTENRTNSTAAERFIMGPETWLGSPFTVTTRYDAIRSLPPTL